MSETLEQAMARGRAPGLDHVRLVAAMAVVVSHAWPLALGQGMPEPLARLLGIKLGGMAVLVFFFLSGVLIAESAARTRNNKWRFVESRIRRIVPGLFVALIVTVLIAVLCGAHPTLSEAVIYVLRGLTLVSLEHTLPGAFAGNPYEGAVNGPLWTLLYEVLCYGMIAVVVWVGIGNSRIRWIIFGLIALRLIFATELVNLPTSAVQYRLSVFAPLGFTFLIGSAVWRLRDRVPLRADLALALIIVALAASAADPTLKTGYLLLGPALGYAALVYGYTPGLAPLPGDISYGIYIYGWPVAQAIMWIWGPFSETRLALWSALAVIPFAIASWVLVEKPALNWRRTPRKAG